MVTHLGNSTCIIDHLFSNSIFDCKIKYFLIESRFIWIKFGFFCKIPNFQCEIQSSTVFCKRNSIVQTFDCIISGNQRYRFHSTCRWIYVYNSWSFCESQVIVKRLDNVVAKGIERHYWEILSFDVMTFVLCN